MSNVFDYSMDYLTEIKHIRIPNAKRKRYFGKTILCVWLTKLCPARCKNCFFKSNMYRVGVPSEMYQFSDYGLERVIKFINDSNNSYLMLSGGGEPMIRKDAVLQIVRRTKTDRIVIVTSGLWATSYERAKEIIFELYEAHQARKDNAVVVLRLSIDEFHYKPLGFDILDRITRVYRESFQDTPGFELRIHTIDGDPTLREVATLIGDCEVTDGDSELMSDNKDVIKIMPKRSTLTFGDGYQIQVGRSKLFYSDLRIDLSTISPQVQRAIDVFDEDMSESEYGNPSIITNTTGPLGLDFWMDYNGNVTTWGNQQWDQLYNVYVDDYGDLVEGTFNNVVSYSFLEKGYYYRERIIRSVNPKAVLRSKALNLRDYAGAILFEEEKTKLYYAIRVVMDYLEEGILAQSDIDMLSPALRSLISGDIEAINTLYHESRHDILSQYLKKDFDQDEWRDLFLLIKLGHYSVDSENLQRSLSYFNAMTDSDLEDISDAEAIDDEIQYGRLHNRISFMKPEAREFCIQVYEEGRES